MSARTFFRIPETIGYVLKIYEKSSNKISLFPDPDVRKFLRKTSNEYTLYQQSLILNSNTIAFNDFSTIVGNSIEPLFKKRIKFNTIDDIPTQELFNITPKPISDEEDSITSLYSKTTSKTSNFFARIVSTFASATSPQSEVPKVPSIENAFKWYIKLLNNTPIVLILSSKNRLFSSSSLSQIDKPLIDLRRKILEISNKLETKSFRSYHLTSLELLDIFQLAIKFQNKFYKQNISEFMKILSQINWQEDIPDDALSNHIKSQERYKIIDKSFKKVDETQFNSFLTYDRFVAINDLLDDREVSDVFLYDLIYSMNYLLCVEEAAINQNYKEILDAIKSSEFEIIAVRLSLDNQEIIKAISDSSHKSDESSGPMNYNALLEKAKDARQESSNIDKLLKALARQNLIRVEEGCHKNCIYLLPPLKK
ncbi:uncharacterized protein RJT21DRAFT_114219 [Scheffersomyces amazonensis]|uniref:uncharacterized protein n=1 Tax=Scheffersomyces amazonensis TaxID=1078765 RepID=UPI00315DE9D4